MLLLSKWQSRGQTKERQQVLNLKGDGCYILDIFLQEKGKGLNYRAGDPITVEVATSRPDQ